MKIKSMLLLMAFGLSACTSGRYAGVPAKYNKLIDQTMATAGANAKELKKALKEAPTSQREGVAFLISYMPERDAKSLSADFLLENVEYAYKARAEFPWAKTVPDSVFLNDVVAYVNLNEARENWRKDFYERFKRYVAPCKTMREAIDSVNKNVRDELLVDYNTKREKPDQAPYESMRQHMASCSGLSILLTDAFRAVGIPSRVAGTPAWHDDRGNHNWNEVWIDGQWLHRVLSFRRPRPVVVPHRCGQGDKGGRKKGYLCGFVQAHRLLLPVGLGRQHSLCSRRECHRPLHQPLPCAALCHTCRRQARGSARDGVQG